MGKIIKVSGPLVVADGMADANMADVVRVGPQQLIGEILNMTGDRASIQVYEETSGLGPGADVVTTGAPLSVELGPGLIENIYDGIQRPLEEIVRRVGSNITRGIQVPPLDRDRLWDFTPTAAVGDTVAVGDILGTVPETESVLHKIMVPKGAEGTVAWLAEAGQYNITQPIARVKLANGEVRELTMVQKWPVRVGRPYKKKFPPVKPLQSGQRVIDTMFPIAKGGAAAVPAAMIKWVESRVDSMKDTPYMVAYTSSTAKRDELVKLCKKAFGHAPLIVFQLGGVVSANTGPDGIAIVYEGKPRNLEAYAPELP